MRRVFAHPALVVVGYLGLVALLAGGVGRLGYVAALEQLVRRGDADLALASDRLTGELQRYRELAVLMADHPALRPLVEGGTDSGGATDLLVRVADMTGSLDIVLAGADGMSLAAARGPVSGSLAAAPEVRRAMDGALGVGHGFDPRYGRRTFRFAAPLFSAAGPVLGAVVVAVDAEGVEAVSRGDRPAIFFTDAAGVVFLSNRSELLYRSRAAGPAAAEALREVPRDRLTPFMAHRDAVVAGHQIWDVAGGPYLPTRALHLTRDLPVIGMTAEALIDVAPAQRLAQLQAALTAALCLVFGAALFLALARRRTLAQANAQLERRVADRTAALSRANTDLRCEVAERTAAQAALTKAQAELVQAGKLSALGQMSAGISHELNQPLMAIRSFADNTEALLARGRTEAVAANISRISELARRMGRIIRNLRAFARHESEPLSDVDLGAAVEAALEMVASKAQKAQVTVHWTPPLAPVMVRAGEVRLGQVVLNLVSNAIDAMEGAARREVSLAIAQTGPRVELSVRDTGPGITEPEKIFDPFYTTKEVGAAESMGLGLSISYGLVQSFGGAIRGRNAPGGGAIFTVELDATPERKAA